MPSQPLHLRLVDADEAISNSVVAMDPISAFEVDHVLKLGLCDVLESIADALPHTADASLATVAVRCLRNGLPEHVALEEKHLFPLLRSRNARDQSCKKVLLQLEHEHGSNESFAYEIADELEHIAEAKAPKNAEMLGYMLRGFFISQRRHIRWENATVIPLARRTLTEADLAELGEAITARNCNDEGLRILETVSDVITNSYGSLTSSQTPPDDN
ncbi:MAG: hemerythrin domain-containing protein [Filomicrobium sp.]